MEADGCVYFDIDLGFRLEHDKVLEKLLNINKIEFDRILTTSFSNSEKMDAILECFLDPTTAGQTYEDIPIDIIEDGCINGDTELRIVDCSDAGIEGTLVLDKDHWARKLQEIKICDLYEDETYTHNPEINPTNPDDYIYDGTRIDWTPLIDWGDNLKCIFTGQLQPQELPEFYYLLSRNGFRPFLFVADVLHRLMCAIGYKLNGDIFDDEKFKRQIDYLLRSDLFTEEEYTRELDGEFTLGAEVTYPTNTQTTSCLPLNVVEDLGGNWNTNKYCGQGCVNVTATISAVITGQGEGTNNVKIRLRKNLKTPINVGGGFLYRSNDCIKILAEEIIDGNAELLGDKAITFEVNEVTITDCEYLCIEIVKEGGSANVVITDANLAIEGLRGTFQKDREYKWLDLLCCETTGLDYFKSIIHEYNGLLSTDTGLRTLLTAQPYKTEDKEGFFKEGEVLDWSEKIIGKTKRIEAPDRADARYVTVQWKKSTDCYIADLDLENELYSRTIDRGEQYTNTETKTYENLLIEPTANKKFPPTSFGASSKQMALPKMCGEGGDDKASWEIGKRRLMTFGYVPHDENGGPDPFITTYDRIRIAWCDDFFNFTELIPTASQFLDCFIGPVSGDDGPDLIKPIDCGLVFNEVLDEEGERIRTLFTDNWERWLKEQLEEGIYQFEAALTPYDFDCIDFRTCIFFYDRGKPVTVRLEELTGFNRCEDGTSVVRMRPFAQGYSPICGSISTGGGGTGGTDDPCNNNPILECEKLEDGCFQFTIGGTNNSVILNATFINKTTNTQIPNTTPISAILCGETNPYDVCATVSYISEAENPCPDKQTQTKTITPCGDNQPEIICGGFYKGTNGYCAKANIGGQIVDAYTLLSLTADGQPYAEGTDLCGLTIGQTVIFEAVINFDDACDPITITLDCLIPVQTQSCSENVVELKCIEDENGCCTVEIDEETRCTVEPIQAVLFWYYCGTSKPDENELGCLWDGKTEVCCAPGEDAYWKAVVKYCGECEDDCIDWTKCEKEGCECEVAINCELCIANIVEPCDGWVYDWYDLETETNGSNVPTFTSSQIINNFALLGQGANGINLPDNRDNWYAVIASQAGCEDVIEYYYHDAPETPTPTGPIKLD